MSSGIFTALSGAVAQSDALDVTASNVANAGTNGFRAERISFGETLTRARAKDMKFTSVSRGKTDISAGEVAQTGNPLDIALDGDGYLALNTARGVRYTRGGTLQIDKANQLVNPDGIPLRNDKGKPIVVPAGAQLAIGEDGSVNADGSAVGKLEIVRFAPTSLKREGAGLFIAAGPPEKGTPPRVVSGALESGNYNVVRGVVDLVRISRSYEALHRMIESYKDIDDRIARSGGG